DNSWTGADRRTICHCPHCTRKFRDETGRDLPRTPDWDDPTYRAWISWSYGCREENWDLFNDVTSRAGGPDCLWLGMVNANPFGSHLNFADLRSIGRRSKILMCDHQSRDSLNGFEQNVVNGALLHAISSPDTVIPQSMAHYVRGRQAFRRASMPAEETRTWMRCGFAGGISPWWHHVGSVQEDRRQFDTSADLMRWHESVDEYLHDRTPIANVALVWSQANNDFYGRDDAHERCALPWRGMTAALTRARIPFDPVHADDLPDAPSQYATLVFPDVAVLADEQVERVLRYVDAGGSVVITGATATLDGEGTARREWPFDRLTGFAPTGATLGVGGSPSSSWEVHEGHSYLRTTDTDPTGLTAGFANTDTLPFGGSLHEYAPRGDEPGPLDVLATLVPPFPIYPPEFAWMRTASTSTPALMAGSSASGGRIVLLPADVDRQYGRLRLPDHGNLLAAAVRWTAGTFPVEVDGPGYLACRLYRHEEGLVLHIVNLSGLNEWPGYVEEILPVGPIEVTVRGDDAGGKRARSLVTGGVYETAGREDGTRSFLVPSLGAHEVVVLPA
ncbi:MAG: Tat pathway signal protein, partial [Spirochaetota bacterium]